MVKAFTELILIAGVVIGGYYLVTKGQAWIQDEFNKLNPFTAVTNWSNSFKETPAQTQARKDTEPAAIVSKIRQYEGLTIPLAVPSFTLSAGGPVSTKFPAIQSLLSTPVPGIILFQPDVQGMLGGSTTYQVRRF